MEKKVASFQSTCLGQTLRLQLIVKNDNEYCIIKNRKLLYKFKKCSIYFIQLRFIRVICDCFLEDMFSANRIPGGNSFHIDSPNNIHFEFHNAKVTVVKNNKTL